MSNESNRSFIRHRIPHSCRSLIDIFMTSESRCQLAAADRWLVEATASHFGEKRFLWGELLTDLAHCYPSTEDDGGFIM